ncbi:hypothetical protein PS057_17235 [Yersinia pestis]|nr:hypothetical protein [Yersinia pestis]
MEKKKKRRKEKKETKKKKELYFSYNGVFLKKGTYLKPLMEKKKKSLEDLEEEELLVLKPS